MILFLVLQLLGPISCELFIAGTGYNTEYAPTYDNYKPRDYEFNYGVSDPHTGDHKSQWEIKKDGVVRGGYSLLEPDGTTRLVEYIADDDGFRAVVKKIGVAVHPTPDLVHAVPQLAHSVSQVAHSLPEVVHSVPQVVHSVSQAVPQLIHSVPEVVHSVPEVVHSVPETVHSVPHGTHPLATLNIPSYNGQLSNYIQEPILSKPEAAGYKLVPSGYQTLDFSELEKLLPNEALLRQNEPVPQQSLPELPGSDNLSHNLGTLQLGQQPPVWSSNSPILPQENNLRVVPPTWSGAPEPNILPGNPNLGVVHSGQVVPQQEVAQRGQFLDGAQEVRVPEEGKIPQAWNGVQVPVNNYLGAQGGNLGPEILQSLPIGYLESYPNLLPNGREGAQLGPETQQSPGHLPSYPNLVPVGREGAQLGPQILQSPPTGRLGSYPNVLPTGGEGAQAGPQILQSPGHLPSYPNLLPVGREGAQLGPEIQQSPGYLPSFPNLLPTGGEGAHLGPDALQAPPTGPLGTHPNLPPNAPISPSYSTNIQYLGGESQSPTIVAKRASQPLKKFLINIPDANN